MSSKFNYKKIYTSLKEDIERKKFNLGDLLPTESELASLHSVSRPTIARAYNLLQDNGYVEKKIGSGTKVIYKEKSEIHTIGLLLPGAGESEIFSMINNRLLEHAKSNKYDFLWEGATAGNAEIRKKMAEIHCKKYISEKVDGILFSPLELIPNAEGLNFEICEQIRNANIPLVLIDRDIVDFPNRSHFDMISLDNYNAGYSMGSYLISKGVETLYFFQRADSAASLTLRLAGIRASAEDHGLKFEKENTIKGNPDDLNLIKNIDIIPGKTGIICANDATAAVFMSSLEQLNIIVGKDVILSGFDNMKYASHLKYSLTSYMQPCEKFADISLELITRRIKNINSTPLTVTLLGEIIERESSSFL